MTKRKRSITVLYLAGRYRVELIDLMLTPQLAARDQIVAVPTAMRKLPLPQRKRIGDLSNEERALVGLDLRELTPPGQTVGSHV